MRGTHLPFGATSGGILPIKTYWTRKIRQPNAGHSPVNTIRLIDQRFGGKLSVAHLKMSIEHTVFLHHLLVFAFDQRQFVLQCIQSICLVHNFRTNLFQINAEITRRYSE